MSVSLSTLAARLQQQVPPRDGVPADYSRLCQEAVGQLGLDAPIVTATTIAVTAGVAAYSLPADFLYLIELGGAPVQGDVLVSDGGLVPLSVGWNEMYYIEGDSLRFDPAPTYTAARTLRYAAAYALVGGAYPRLSENGARVALLYAQHLALSEQANAATGDGWSYKIGDESVDKRGLGAAIQTQAAAALQNYEVALRPFRGRGSTYRQNPYAVGVGV